CKMSQSRINVFVPPINNFPELILGGYALKDRVQVLPQGQGQGQNQGQRSKSKPSSTEPLEERELQYLYVIDSQGRLLEHMRYSGDYRVALREAFASENIVPSKIALNSQAQSDLKRE
ncbi:hypothetical protein KR059_010147, partial [Drosophila kikkawai]